jgi:hypothetical protein
MHGYKNDLFDCEMDRWYHGMKRRKLDSHILETQAGIEKKKDER